jgi:4-amino-4-deoxy-L-arabinose transferase-like glycosyltransferase
MFAITLSLILLVLTLLDGALTMENMSLMVVSLILLGILGLLSTGLFLKTRRLNATDTPVMAEDHTSAARAGLIVLALTFLAAALRLYDLGQESLWVDEVWTAWFATRPLGQVLQAANPLAYMVARFTLPLSRSEFALRFAPALAGVALIPAIYLLGRTMYGRKEGLTAAALMTVSVYAIEHSQEVRFYAWQMLFSTLTLYFLLRGLEGGRWRDWVGFALTTALNLFSHPFAVFVLASEGLYALWYLVTDTLGTGSGANVPFATKLRALFRRSIAPGTLALVALAVFLPMVPHLLSFNNSLWVAGGERAQHLPLGMENVSWLSWPVVFGTYGMLAEYLNLRSVPFLVYPFLVLFFLGLLCERRRSPLILLWFLVPLPILFLTKYWLQPRYLSYFLPLILLVSARGITWLATAITPARRKDTLALVALTGLVALPSLIQLPAYYAEPQEDQWREVTAFVEVNHRAGDLVLISSAYDPTPLPFEWYATLPAKALPRQVFPEGPVTGVLTHLEQLDSLPAIAEGHDRVWFVYCYVNQDNQALVAKGMQEDYRIADQWEFVGLDLVLFEKRTP